MIFSFDIEMVVTSHECWHCLVFGSLQVIFDELFDCK